MSDRRDSEDKQHERVMRVLKSHFGNLSVESDIQDAAWSVLAVLDDYLIDAPSAFPKLKERMKMFSQWAD